MGAIQKRRSSPRSKSQKSAKVNEAKKPIRPREWLRDLFSLSLVAVGLALVLSLGSFCLALARGAVPTPSGNIVGPVGHVVATLMVGMLGWVACLPVAWLFWLAFFRPRVLTDDEKKKHHPALSVAAGLACILAFAAILELVSRGSALGGSLGGQAGGTLRSVLGHGGALLLAGLAGATSLAILLQRSIGDVAQGVRWGVQKGSAIAFLSFPKVVLAGGRWCGSSVLSALVSCAQLALNLGFRRGPARKVEEAPLPKPRVRKNAVEVASVSIDETSAPERVERADPIIVKPKQSELFVVKDAKGRKTQGKGAAKAPGTPEPNTRAFDGYVHPDLNLLNREDHIENSEDDEELRQKAEQIESKLRDFNIAGRVTQVHPGPVITLFEFEPAAGVKVGRIAALQDDLAMSLKASSIRIIAPIPKRGTVGIEVPNKKQAMVRLRDCLESEAFAHAESLLSVPLGKDTYGDPVVVDIAAMPHLLMAGATGTGKSVSINALLLSLLYRAHPAELGLILIDPKVLELSIYDGIPHLRVPVVTDPRQAKAVLSWAVKEMDRRYRYMQKFGVRNIDGYNKVVSGEEDAAQVRREQEARDEEARRDGASPVDDAMASGMSEAEVSADTSAEGVESIAPEKLRPLPKIVIVIDELADLMLTVGREIEELITRLAQKARAAGIHLILATQRPSVDVITGLIKANFPARLSFRVSSRIDSRTILDSMGAEKLLGKGDMLFMLPGAVPLKRVHGAFVSDSEVQDVVGAIKAQCTPEYDEDILAACERALKEESSGGDGSQGEGGEGDEYDPFYDKAVELVLEKGQASTSMVQRTFRIGYNRAARIIEMMEREGIVGKMDGVKPREILMPPLERGV